MKAKRFTGWLLSAALLAGAAGGVLPARAAGGGVTLSRQEVYDKIAGSWVGQMAGATWGQPTEFQFNDCMLAESDVPVWKPSEINAGFAQDDLFVEIPFIQALLDHGVDCDVKTVGEYFRDTSFPLCEANLAARVNLRAGISAPMSGHYLYSNHTDDLDWQIESNFVGQMLPGLVNAAINKSWELGHIVCYGDGVYGGVYVAAMQSRAFTADTLDEILEAGRQSVPEGSLFREVIEDVYSCYDKGMTWQQTWQVVNDKWWDKDHCIYGKDIPFNIDAKLNSAYVLMGLLYGRGDFEESMKISMMCGQDSDCNPSTVGAILGSWKGYDWIPDKWKSALQRTGSPFAFTDYDFNTAVENNLSLAEEAFVKYGGSISGDTWAIPASLAAEAVVPPPLEQLPEICPLDIQIAESASSFTFYLRAYDDSMIQSVAWDFGDGSTGEGIRATHSYSASGYYTVKCTITSHEGEVFTREKACISGRNIASQGTPVVSHQPEGGGGNMDIGVIADGVRPIQGEATLMQQFDTFQMANPNLQQWIGYTFDEEHTFGMVVFQEGEHFVDGGWFKNGLHIQVQRDGQWVDVSYTGDKYPVASDREAFGESFETFCFYLNNETGTGIRLYGSAGGSSYFISCAELEVYEEGAAIQDPDSPSPSLPVVENGEVHPLFSMSNYDWTWEQDLVITPDNNGCLILQNMNGKWPKADYVPATPLTAEIGKTRLWYDFKVSSGVNTSLIVFFGDEGNPLDNERSVSLNSLIPGAVIEPGSGDIVGNDKRYSGYLDLANMGLDPAWITDGKAAITGFRAYAAGAELTPVILGQFALVSADPTLPDPSTDPSTDPSAGPSTAPSSDPSADPSSNPSSDPSTDPTATAPSTPSASGQKPGTNPSTGAGLPLAAGALMAVSASALVWCRRKHGK